MSQNTKMKAFALNAKNKKEQEKQKKLADEEAAAEVYEEFVATFEAPKHSQPKLFVRGNVINPASGQEVSPQQSGKYYKPEKLKEFERKKEVKKVEEKKLSKPVTVNEKPPKKKGDVKKKSNLEMFKEELKMLQEEREERFRMRSQMRDKPSANTSVLDDDDSRKSAGSHDNGDPNTTNIYLGSLNPKLTEAQLCEIFGRYGPLASVKIMWPRTDEERTRNRNCGFVAFMCRKDGERALKAMNGRVVMDFEMRLGWGKAIPIPSQPIYIPKVLRDLTIPPPNSGLPFNAQVVDEKDKKLLERYGDPQVLFREDKEAFYDLLLRTVVKVVIPTEKPLLNLIHRVIEFVVREGPMFEAELMNREAKNPMFSFLFDNQSQAHVYYRWRLFSVLHGDHPSKWRTKEFVMFKGGSKWIPPIHNLYQRGMPEELLPKDDEFKLKCSSPDLEEDKSDGKRGQLGEVSREKMEDMLRTLTPERTKISDLMVFCIEHADACEEIIECITDSLCIPETPLHKKIARLFLLNDILHNCTVKVANVSNYRKQFQTKLDRIFESLNQAYNQIEGRLKAEHFKQKVMNCFRAWQDSALFNSDLLIKLQNIFLGLYISKQPAVQEVPKASVDDIDGIPIADPDIDGVEIDNNFNSNSFSEKFKPSKWETVDPDVVVSQAITSRWENLEKSTSIFPDDDIDGKPLEDTDYFDSLIDKDSKTSKSTEQWLSRKTLRDIELKVINYQDELESNHRSGKLKLNTDTTINQMVENYRADLVKMASSHEGSRSPSPSKARHSKRRSKSRSPPAKRRK